MKATEAKLLESMKKSLLGLERQSFERQIGNGDEHNGMIYHL
jgi:hypothetical protein